MNKKLKIIALSVVFATAGYAKDTHTGLNKLEMQKVFSSSDVKTMKLDVKEKAGTEGKMIAPWYWFYSSEPWWYHYSR